METSWTPTSSTPFVETIWTPTASDAASHVFLSYSSGGGGPAGGTALNTTPHCPGVACAPNAACVESLCFCRGALWSTTDPCAPSLYGDPDMRRCSSHRDCVRYSLRGMCSRSGYCYQRCSRSHSCGSDAVCYLGMCLCNRGRTLKVLAGTCLLPDGESPASSTRFSVLYYLSAVFGVAVVVQLWLWVCYRRRLPVGIEETPVIYPSTMMTGIASAPRYVVAAARPNQYYYWADGAPASARETTPIATILPTTAAAAITGEQVSLQTPVSDADGSTERQPLPNAGPAPGQRAMYEAAAREETCPPWTAAPATPHPLPHPHPDSPFSAVLEPEERRALPQRQATTLGKRWIITDTT